MSDDTPGDGQIELPGFTAPGSDVGSESSSPSSIPTHSVRGRELPPLDEGAHGAGLRNRLASFLTGQRAEGRDVRSQLIQAFGSSRRDPSRPDTQEAAKRLGVSQRSVQRWIKGGGIRPDTARTIERRARQSTTTKRGRQQAMRRAERSGTATRPPGRNGILVEGTQGVKSAITDNYRPRECGVVVTDADLKGMRQAWIDGGEQGAAAWLQHHYDEHYQPDWHIRDIDGIEWTNSQNYHRDDD